MITYVTFFDDDCNVELVGSCLNQLGGRDAAFTARIRMGAITEHRGYGMNARARRPALLLLELLITDRFRARPAPWRGRNASEEGRAVRCVCP